jgi:hypothetical protein
VSGRGLQLRLADVNRVDVPMAAATKTSWGVGANGFVVQDGAALPLAAHESFLELRTDDLDAMRAAWSARARTRTSSGPPRSLPNGRSRARPRARPYLA